VNRAIAVVMVERGAHRAVFRLEKLPQGDGALGVARQCVRDLKREVRKGLADHLQMRRQMAGVPVTPFTALQAAAVYACIRAISQDMAMLAPFIRRRVSDGFLRVPTHPLNKLFRRPNRWQTWFEFIAYVVSSICLRGNAFIVVERDQDSSWCRSRLTAVRSCSAYRINSRRLGFGIVVPPDDMIHVKNISLDGYVGISPIAIAQDVRSTPSRSPRTADDPGLYLSQPVVQRPQRPRFRC
jgi:hypothetical protein